MGSCDGGERERERERACVVSVELRRVGWRERPSGVVGMQVCWRQDESAQVGAPHEELSAARSPSAMTNSNSLPAINSQLAPGEGGPRALTKKDKDDWAAEMKKLEEERTKLRAGIPQRRRRARRS